MFYNYECKIIKGPILLRDTVFFTKNVCCGASVSFFGLVRSRSFHNFVVAISYEIFDSLLLVVFRRICFNIFEKYGKFVSIKMVQSKGFVCVGESSIFINVCTPHRDDSFKICRYVLESIKKNAPIWKKEHSYGSDMFLFSSTIFGKN